MNIISFDGGGIRGVFSARLVERLSSEVPGLLKRTQFVAGTSTGGIIALGLAAGLEPKQLVNLYLRYGPDIFRQRYLYWLGIGSKYSNKVLKRVLCEHLGDVRLKNLKKLVMVPSYDLDALATKRKPRMGKAKFWGNFPRSGADLDELAVDVAMRTSAAPTFFPTYDGHIDGGVVVNNPVSCAIAEARAAGTRDIHVLSIGTGYYPTYVEGDEHDHGLVWWAPRLFDIMIGGVGGIDGFQARHDLGPNRYYRLDGILSSPVAMDDARSIPWLIAQADSMDLTSVCSWLRSNWL